MKRNILFIALILATASCLAQNYYEVPYVGKNSRLTEIVGMEKECFIQSNSIPTVYEALDKKDVASLFFYETDRIGYCQRAILENVYREDVPDEKGQIACKIYRCIYSLGNETSLGLATEDETRRRTMGQVIYVLSEGRLAEYYRGIYYGTENFYGLDSRTGVVARNIQFRVVDGALLALDVSISRTLYYSKRDSEQLESELVIYCTPIAKITDKTKFCRITADSPLIDKKNPFKYSIQNAFDGNSATSYVEDTENDLFELEVNFDVYSRENNLAGQFIDAVAIVNGYASNKSLYVENNRIKKVQYTKFSTPPLHFVCDDFQLDSQYIPIPDPVSLQFRFLVKEIYSGTKYSDTALAELDLRTTAGHWLFTGGQR